MATVASRGSSVVGTVLTTWASTANAFDGTVGTNPATYATWVNAARSTVGQITIGGYTFSGVGPGETINSVTAAIRHLETSTSVVSSVTVQLQTSTGTNIGSAVAVPARSTTAITHTLTLGTPTAAQVNAGLRVLVSVTRSNSTTSTTFSLDYVDLTVDYTPIAGVGSSSGTYAFAGTATGVAPFSPAANEFLHDNYTDADGTLLSAHSPELGGTWSLQTGTSGSFTITGNEAWGGTTDCHFINSAAPTNADYDVIADLHIVSAISNTGNGVLGRALTSANTAYMLFLYSFSGTWYLYLSRWVTGGYAELTHVTLPTQPSVGSTHQIKLSMRGTAIKGSYDGTELISVTNSEVTAAGFAGISTAANTATTGVHFNTISALNSAPPANEGTASGNYGWNYQGPALPLNFVTRDSTTGYLMLNGQRFRFGGANVDSYYTDAATTYGETIQGNGAHVLSHAAIDSLVPEIAGMNLSVVRAFLCAIGNPGTFMPTINTYDHTALEPVDYFVATLQNYGVRIVSPLVDDFDYFDHGKFTWCTLSGVTPNGNADEFFTNATVIANFKAYVNALLNHTNIYTGIKYKDDPMWLAWETGNELDNTAASRQALLDWTLDVAQYIKVTVGAQQLVHDGKWGILGANDLMDATYMNSPYIDFYTEHSYDQWRTPDHMANQAALAHNYGKGFIVGEYPLNGLNQSGGTIPTWTPAQLAAAVEGNTNLDGDLFWNLLPQGNTHGQGYYNHYPGDVGNAAMIARVNAYQTHAIAMAGSTVRTATVPRKTATLSDTFATYDSAKFNLLSTASITGGQAVLPTGNTGVISAFLHDLSNSEIVVQLVQKNPGTGASQCGIGIQPTNGVYDTSNFVGFIIDGNTVKYRSLVGGGITDGTTETYSATTHRWLRLRASPDATVFPAYPVSSGTIYWDVSSDGVTWVNKRTWTPVNIMTTSNYVLLTNWNYGGDAGSGTAIFDNLNVSGAVAPTNQFFAWA
jgi:hypothetical protein